MTTTNPFAQRSTLEFELPPFSQIRNEDYLPAFYSGCEAQLAEVKAILDAPGAATFENTIVALNNEELGEIVKNGRIMKKRKKYEQSKKLMVDDI